VLDTLEALVESLARPGPSPNRFRGVLFDFDGTLADSYPAITASVNHVRSLYGLPPLPEAEVRRHVGRGAAYLLDKTVPRGGLAANVEAYRAHHPSVLQSGTSLLPGAAARPAGRDGPAGWRRASGGGERPALARAGGFTLPARLESSVVSGGSRGILITVVPPRAWEVGRRRAATGRHQGH